MDVVNIYCWIKVILFGYICLNCGYWGILMNIIRYFLVMLLWLVVINVKKCIVGCLKFVIVMFVIVECVLCWKWKFLWIFIKVGNV